METVAPALPRGRVFAARHPHDRFLVIAVLIYIWAGILGGFGPGAVEHLSGAGPVRPARLHLHAVAFFGWLGLLTVQIGLVRSGWVEWHRRLGIGGALLAAAMVPLGVWASVASVPGRIARDSNPGFVAVPLLDMVVFAVLVTAALRMRGQLAAHRRLILLATLQLTGAGFGRWLGPVLGPAFAEWGALGGWIALYGMPMVGVAAIAVWDGVTRRRLHPAYVWGAALMVMAQALAVVLVKNEAWVATVVKFAG